MNAVDGGKTVITGRVDSTLNSAAMALQPGVLVHMKSCKGDSHCLLCNCNL
jgi:hypothetical protein